MAQKYSTFANRIFAKIVEISDTARIKAVKSVFRQFSQALKVLAAARILKSNAAAKTSIVEKSGEVLAQGKFVA